MTQQLWSISWANLSDADAMVPLFEELYRHEGTGSILTDKVGALDHVNLLLDPATPHKLAIAWSHDGRAIGLAAVGMFISISDPRPSHRRQMELKELFVLPQLRGAGIGQALIGWIEAEAISAGACRIDWHVKIDNHRGIAFYRRQGATMVENRASMRKLLQN